jgi:glycosyltransferase involved in cell wall biosynthesis
VKVSVVVPVYHNAPSLPILHERLVSVAMATPQAEFEFLFVDDGSSDSSFDVLKRLALEDNRVRALRLVRNFGSNAAILAGLTYATGNCAVVIAADLQDPPELIHDMVLRWCEGNPVVLAARAERHEPLMTRLFAGLFNRLYRRVVFANFPPKGFDFFLVDRRVVDVLVKMPERNAYLMGLLLWAGFPSVTLSYVRENRPFGRSQFH